jgi:hypothetical protein
MNTKRHDTQPRRQRRAESRDQAPRVTSIEEAVALAQLSIEMHRDASIDNVDLLQTVVLGETMDKLPPSFKYEDVEFIDAYEESLLSCVANLYGRTDLSEAEKRHIASQLYSRMGQDPYRELQKKFNIAHTAPDHTAGWTRRSVEAGFGKLADKTKEDIILRAGIINARLVDFERLGEPQDDKRREQIVEEANERASFVAELLDRMESSLGDEFRALEATIINFGEDQRVNIVQKEVAALRATLQNEIDKVKAGRSHSSSSGDTNKNSKSSGSAKGSRSSDDTTKRKDSGSSSSGQGGSRNGNSTGSPKGSRSDDHKAKEGDPGPHKLRHERPLEDDFAIELRTMVDKRFPWRTLDIANLKGAYRDTVKMLHSDLDPSQDQLREEAIRYLNRRYEEIMRALAQKAKEKTKR